LSEGKKIGELESHLQEEEKRFDNLLGSRVDFYLDKYGIVKEEKTIPFAS
jgi:hypothetical protein